MDLGLRLAVVGVSTVLFLASSSHRIESQEPTRAEKAAALDRALNEESLKVGLSEQDSRFYAQELSDAIDARIELIREEMTLWENEVVPLIKGDEGRYIAASPESLDAVAYFYLFRGSERPTPTQLESFERRVKANQSYMSHSSGAVPAEIIQKLEGWVGTLNGYYDAYLDARTTFEIELSRAKKEVGQKSDLTLETAMSMREADLAREEGAMIAEAVAQARREGVEVLAAVQAQKESAMLRRVITDIELETAKIERESEKMRKAAQREVQKETALSPEVLLQLAPFTMKGRTEPYVSMHAVAASGPISKKVSWREANPPVAISYGFLIDSFALQNSPEGLKRLIDLAGSSKNDRPGWPQPYTEEDWEDLRMKQKLLRDYGPILVKEGHLAP